MNYRHATILANEDLGASGTKIIDVDIIDPITRITLVHQPVGGSNTPVAHPAKNISKLELVDGSDVLYSLSGTEGQALNVFESKVSLLQEIDFRTGGTPLCYVHMDFGRFLGDPELAFDPKKFANPQLKLTWNEVAYDASCTSHAFIIFAHTFDQKVITPVGFLMSKEHKAYTPTSGGHEYTDLPTDYPIRKLILQGMKAGAGVRGLIETIKLDEDNDKRIIIDGDIHELRSFLDEMVGECCDAIRGNVLHTASVNYFCTPHNVFTVSPVGDTAARVIIAGAASGGRFYLQAETGTTGVMAYVRGKNPHGCICLPFGNQDDMADWFDVTRVGKLRLRIKGGTSSASGDQVAIVAQQLRRY